jgi:hypothetical protein
MFDFAQTNIRVNLSILGTGIGSAAMLVCYFAGPVVLFFSDIREP